MGRSCPRPRHRPPTTCSPRSTRSSARWPPPCAARSACWPAPAPARPGRSPTGSPTASTRGSTRRSGCSRSPSPPGPPVRCAAGCASWASRACRPAPSTAPRCASCATSGPRVVGGDVPRLVESKIGLVGQAAGAARIALSRPALRDVAAEIEWAKVSRTAADDYPAALAAAGREPPADLDPAQVGRLYAGVRGGQARAGRARLRGRAAAHRGGAAGAGRRRRPGARPVPAPRGRRVPGRQPAAAGAARPVAGPAGRPLRGR